MNTSEHTNNIFFPIVEGTADGQVVLCEVSGDIYDQPGHLNLIGVLKKHAGLLEAIRASEAKLRGHKLMDRRLIISTAPLGSGQYYNIDGSSCLLALVLMDRALRHPETRTTRRVIATGAVEADGQIAAIPKDNISDYLAKTQKVEWREGDIFVCPAKGLTEELKRALDQLRGRGVKVRAIRHVDEFWPPPTDDHRCWLYLWLTVNIRKVLWGLTLAAVLLIIYVGSGNTPIPPLPQPPRPPFESALGVNILLQPQGGGAPIRTLAGHVFTRGDRVSLELESSVAGQVAVFDTSGGASGSPIPLALAKVDGSQQRRLPVTGSWALDGAPGTTQTLAVAFSACVETACSHDFMTEAQMAVVQTLSGNQVSPPGRIALISPHGQAAVARITLPY